MSATNGSSNHSSPHSSAAVHFWWNVRPTPVSFRCRFRADMNPTPHGQNMTTRVITSHRYLKAISNLVKAGSMEVTWLWTANRGWVWSELSSSGRASRYSWGSGKVMERVYTSRSTKSRLKRKKKSQYSAPSRQYWVVLTS